MFTLFSKRPTNHYHPNNQQTYQRNLALNITDLAYTKQVADFFQAHGIQAEPLKPSCKFGPNLRINMNGLIVVARTVKAPDILDVKDIRPYFSMVEVYKANAIHNLPNPLSTTPYIITNIGYTREAEYEARNRGIILHYQPIVQPQMV